MKARSRNNALIFLCLAAFILLRVVGPDSDTESVVTARGWDWRLASTEPSSALGIVKSDSRVAVRVLGTEESLEARTTAELLWSVGLVGVRIGPPSNPNKDEVWILPRSAGCEHADAAAEHVQRGGKLLTWTHCPELLLRLGAPPAAAYEGVPGQTAFGADGAVPAPALRLGLPLPTSAQEFLPGGFGTWTPVANRAGGSGAVVIRGSGATLVSFDWSRFVRELRQGDPSLSGRDRDGLHGVKPNDLRPYPWALPLWRQPVAEYWVDLLAAEVAQLSDAAGNPLPRLWPLPTPAPSALIMTADQDFSEESWIDPLLARVEAAQGDMTVLTTLGTRQANSEPALASGGTFLSQETLERARAWGHGFGLHPNVAGLTDADGTYDADGAAAAIRAAQTRVQRALGEAPRVVRNHYLSWWASEEPAEIAAALGLWMDLSFVSIGPEFDSPGFGFGSARPARFVGRQRTLPLLLQATQIEDDVWAADFDYSHKLSSEGAVTAAGSMFDVALEAKVPLVANVHPLWVVKDGGLFFDGLLAAAKERGLPILSAERWAVQSWDRLQLAMSWWPTDSLSGGSAGFSQDAVVPMPPGDGASSPDHPPQWIWRAGGDCPGAESRPSPFAPLGCLRPLLR